jgi:hypothetical protein
MVMDSRFVVIMHLEVGRFRTPPMSLVDAMVYSGRLLCRGVHTAINPATSGALRDLAEMSSALWIAVESQLCLPATVTMVACLRCRLGTS